MQRLRNGVTVFIPQRLLWACKAETDDITGYAGGVTQLGAAGHWTDDGGQDHADHLVLMAWWFPEEAASDMTILVRRLVRKLLDKGETSVGIEVRYNTSYNVGPCNVQTQHTELRIFREGEAVSITNP